jgi:hypothetical protein
MEFQSFVKSDSFAIDVPPHGFVNRSCNGALLQIASIVQTLLAVI